jgi:thiol-disulfide isomerase/thioredoxin
MSFKSSKTTGTVIGFFADFCGHCTNYKPEFDKLKTVLEEKYHIHCIKVVLKNSNKKKYNDDMKRLQAQFGVSGRYPVVIFIPHTIPNGEDVDSFHILYTKKRTSEALLDEILKTKNMLPKY